MIEKSLLLNLFATDTALAMEDILPCSKCCQILLGKRKRRPWSSDV